MLFLGAFSAVEELSEHERMSAFLLDSVAATQTNSTTFLDDDSQAHDEERGSYCSIVAELRHLELDLVEVTASCQENIDEIHFWRFAPWEEVAAERDMIAQVFAQERAHKSSLGFQFRTHEGPSENAEGDESETRARMSRVRSRLQLEYRVADLELKLEKSIVLDELR